uniref:non-specific serine/threonine protein kinase n=1 Tax=Solanum tuberosum TaxID=4113 RepID=M1CNX7_SOLTU
MNRLIFSLKDLLSQRHKTRQRSQSQKERKKKVIDEDDTKQDNVSSNEEPIKSRLSTVFKLLEPGSSSTTITTTTTTSTSSSTSKPTEKPQSPQSSPRITESHHNSTTNIKNIPPLPNARRNQTNKYNNKDAMNRLSRVQRSGTSIAVKVFNLQVEAAFKSFDTECEVLRNLQHRNLVKVITSCSNLDFKALVLKYMPDESLEKYLYSHNYFLDIRQTLSIMIDVACALEYLHYGCSLPMIHCDLKPSNVLLDEDMVAHLSDFGISKLLSEDESDLYTKTLATFGYIAPGAVMDVIDVNLVTPLDNRLQKKLVVVPSIMKVALDCCVESPARRINMKDVVGMLQKIMIQLLAR